MSLEGLGIDIVLCVAGFVGALISVGRRSASNIRMTMTQIIAGVGSANYLTPLITENLSLDHGKWHTGLAFMLGTIGLKAMEFINIKAEFEFKKRFLKSDDSKNKEKESKESVNV